MSESDLAKRAISHLQRQELGEAEQLYRQILAARPSDDNALFMLGMIRYNHKDYKQALQFVSQAIHHNNNNARYYYNLGIVWRDTGDVSKALRCFEQAVVLQPDYVAAHFNKGVMAHQQNNHDAALAAYKAVLALEPKHYGAHNNSGAIYYQRSDYAKALDHYRAVVALAPESPEALNNLAALLMDMQQEEEAIRLFQQAIAHEGCPAYIHSNLLMNLHYDEGQDKDSLFTAHKAWGARYEVGEHTPHANPKSLNKILHIGYVSGDFRAHPVGFFLLKALACHNTQQFKLHCYNSSQVRDAVTAQIKERVHVWRDIAGLNDEEAERSIRADSIDILVDLSGHTADNRLLLFARKPAPVQVSWLGYFNTTGMKKMDYFLTDHTHAPEGYEAWFTETLMRLPDGYMCYTPPALAPMPAPAPVLVKRYITFGCFNNISKINQQVIESWAEVLQQVKGSRLVLKAKALNSPSVQEKYKAAFAAVGIEPDRLELRGWSGYLEMLEEYQQIDIALDPFPFSGGLTSCDALWMGVPVVTIAGEWIVSRQTASYLTQIGLPQLIAQDRAAYRDLAVELGHNISQLHEVREGLREKMAVSPLCNGERFAANLEAAYREMWRRYCDK